MPLIRQPQGTLRNCKSCGKVFVAMRNEKFCPTCAPVEAEKQKKITEYLREHRGVPMTQVLEDVKAAGDMGSSHEVEAYMFREGLVEGAPHQNVCASCGTPIADGLTYCKKCFQAWMRTVQSHADAPPAYLMSHAPGDPDRAAAIDVAELSRAAMYGGGKANRPHGPGGQKPSSDERRRLRAYMGIIEPRRSTKRDK